jgi:hypothetical protein
MIAAPLCLYVLSPLALLPSETEFPSFADKAWQLAFPFSNYILPLDIATVCAVGAFLLACIAKGRCRITPGSGLALLVVAALFLAAPSAVKGTYSFYTRFAMMLGFLLFGAVLPTELPRAAMLTAVTAFTLLFAVRMAIVGIAWYGHRHDVADMRVVIAAVAPGVRVFLASVSPEEASDYWRNSPPGRRQLRLSAADRPRRRTRPAALRRRPAGAARTIGPRLAVPNQAVGVPLMTGGCLRDRREDKVAARGGDARRTGAWSD